MSGWREFELEWTSYLNKKYGNFASFEHVGDADSTVPDIKVTTDKRTFFIEVKKCPAQCGQFVLFSNNETKGFIYSEQNITPINKYSESIVKYMNNHYETFNQAGKRGENIIFDNAEEVFAKWIIETYQNKGVELIATNEHRLFPLNDLLKYFNVTAKYRIKRSGSRKIGINNIKSVAAYIKKHFHLSSYQSQDGRLFYQTQAIENKTKFIIKNNRYMFSKCSDGLEIKKLSNTNNKNVIFSVKLKKDAPKGMSSKKVEMYLK